MSIFTDDVMKMCNEAKVMLLKNRSGATMAEPVTTFANGEACVFGNVVDGVASTLENTSFDDLLGDL